MAGCRALRIMDLKQNEIRDKGAKALAHALFGGGGPSLVELNLAQNRIGDLGAAALVKAVASGGESKARPLQRLVLRRNAVTAAGHRALCRPCPSFLQA